VSGEIIATVCEAGDITLKAAPRRIAYPDVPIPYARGMEQFCLPNPEKVAAAAREVCRTTVSA